MDKEKKVTLKDVKEIVNSESELELEDDSDDDRTPYNPHHSAHNSILQLQLDANVEVEVEVGGKKNLQYACGNSFLGTLSLVPQNIPKSIEDSSAEHSSTPYRNTKDHESNTKLDSVNTNIIQSEVVFGLTDNANNSKSNIHEIKEKERSEELKRDCENKSENKDEKKSENKSEDKSEDKSENKSENKSEDKDENSPNSSFSFGGIGLLSYSDIIELLSNENTGKKFK